MSEVPTVEPEVEIKEEEHILVLPGHLFFVDHLELPDGLEDAELDNFAELSLEGLAPFPIDQLYWGFLQSESTNSILVYATPKDRLKSLGYDSIERYTWVLPDFATFAGAHFPEEKTIVLNSPAGVSRILLPAGESLPSTVQARQDASQIASPIGGGREFTIEPAGYTLNDQGVAKFFFTTPNADDAETLGHWKALCPTESSLWRADVREPTYKSTESNKRRMTKWATLATGYAALFAVLLVVLEVLLSGGNLWIGTQSATIALQAPEVRRIEDKQSLMNKLDQVAQNELRPIAILEALNRSRPKGIYFTGTVTEGQNRITIDGIANTINELNAYTETLRNSGTFELLSDPKTLTRGGKTTFTVTLDYKHTSIVKGQNG
ncbi:MAG: PilN domain-containing protein [Opitutales bacterium]